MWETYTHTQREREESLAWRGGLSLPFMFVPRNQVVFPPKGGALQAVRIGSTYVHRCWFALFVT